MKSRHKTILYLIIVVISWGVFVYRFWNLSSGEGENNTVAVASKYTPATIEKKESFDLLPIERDPFLGTIKKKTTGKPRIRRKKETIIWPSITYLGMMEDGKGKEKVFILQINGQQYLLGKGEGSQDVNVLRGNSENILVKFKGQTKEINL